MRAHASSCACEKECDENRMKETKKDKMTRTLHTRLLDLKFKASDLNWFQVMGKSTYCIKAVLEYIQRLTLC